MSKTIKSNDSSKLLQPLQALQLLSNSSVEPLLRWYLIAGSDIDLKNML
jgi:hypothetical protein